MNSSIVSIIATLVVLVGVFMPLGGANAADDMVSDDWEVTIAPYLFMTSINGDSTVGRVEAPVDVSFKDILKNLRMGAMLRTEARKGQWGGIVDLFYARLGPNNKRENAIIERLRVEQLVLEIMGFYRLPMNTGAVDLYGGVRIWDINIDLHLRDDISEDPIRRGGNWVDPVLGMRYIVPFSDRLTGSFAVDVGGFGVGSQFSWQVLMGFEYQISESFSMTFQYRALDVNYSGGVEGTPDRFVYDAMTHGPLIGFVFTL